MWGLPAYRNYRELETSFLIDHESERYDGEMFQGVKEHERRVFQKMISMEACPQFNVSSPVNVMAGVAYEMNGTMRSRAGVLCLHNQDHKMKLVATLVQKAPAVHPDTCISPFYINHFDMISFSASRTFQEHVHYTANVILCRDIHFFHWKRMLLLGYPVVSHDRIAFIKTKTDITKMLQQHHKTPDRFSVILVSDDVSEDFCNGFAAYNILPRFQRVIIDAADKIRIPGRIAGLFYWFMSEMPCNLRWPSGIVQPGLNIMGCETYGIVRRLFFSVEQQPNDWFLNLLVKCRPEYERACLNHRSVRFHNVPCRDVPLRLLLNGIIPHTSVEALLRGDIDQSIKLLGCESFAEPESVVTKLSQKLRDDRDSACKKRRRLEFAMAREDNREAMILAAENSIEMVNEKIEALRQRILDVNVCPISMEEIRNKTILPCCGNACEYGSIVHYFHHGQEANSCPFCRASVNPMNLMVIHDRQYKSSVPPRTQALVNTLNDIFERNADAKVVFYDNELVVSKRYFPKDTLPITLQKVLPYVPMAKLSEASSEYLRTTTELHSLGVNADQFSHNDNIVMVDETMWDDDLGCCLGDATDIVFSSPVHHDIEELVYTKVFARTMCPEGVHIWRVQYVEEEEEITPA